VEKMFSLALGKAVGMLQVCVWGERGERGREVGAYVWCVCVCVRVCVCVSVCVCV